MLFGLHVVHILQDAKRHRAAVQHHTHSSRGRYFVGTPPHASRGNKRHADILPVVLSAEAGSVDGHRGGQTPRPSRISILTPED